METPGRRIILDLLAQSIAKINAVYPETGSKSAEKKRKKLNEEKSSMNKKKKTKHEDCNEQDCLPLSNDHLTSIKTKVRTENIKIETENTADTIVEGTSCSCLKTNKVKRDYSRIGGTSGLKTNKVKTENIKIEITEAIDNTNVKVGGTNKVKTEYIEMKTETTYSNTMERIQEYEVTSTTDTPGRRYILDLLAKSVAKIKVVKSENSSKDAVEGMGQYRQKKSKVETVKTKQLELKRIKESSDQTKIKAEDTETKTQGSIAKNKFEKAKSNLNVTKAIERKHNTTIKSRTHKRFSPEEDQILLHAVETFGDKISIRKLAKELNRFGSVISNRIDILNTGGKKRIRSFTNTEDLVIIDAVIKHLPGKSLEMLDLPSPRDWKQIGDQLNRRKTHVKNRWEYYLKPWLLQHFSGTLNLDIRRMLANYLADNFEDVDSIDWPAVASRPEFEGHTKLSLHYYFGAYLFQGAKIKMKGGIEVTLKHIQDNENEQFKNKKLRKVRDKVLSRQKEVIDHFEKYVKQQDKLKLYSK